MDYELRVTAEPKDDVTIEGVRPALPLPGDLASRLQDVLADVTKHDGLLGWRVTAVRPADGSLP
jgi:hypothetical protein